MGLDMGQRAVRIVGLCECVCVHVCRCVCVCVCMCVHVCMCLHNMKKLLQVTMKHVMSAIME